MTLLKNLLLRYNNFKVSVEKLKDIPLLFTRLVLAYGFYLPAMNKINNIGAIAGWFAELGIPAPHLNAYLSAGTEAAGIVLLALGLGTRFITVPLIINMIVAIITVHWSNGFEAGNNGFEIPLYYIIMLLILFVLGPGKSSVDHLLSQKFQVE